jgi:hypothetical protein
MSFPANHWMGPYHQKRTKDEWDKDYGRSWRALKFCLDNWIQRKGGAGQNANFQKSCRATQISKNEAPN